MGPLIRTQTIRNYLRGMRITVDLKIRKRPIVDITRYERRFSSQNGEDGILEAIFTVIGTTRKYFVEFGAASGRECNTARLAQRYGWTGLLMDAATPPPDAPVPIRREFITAENINALFEKYNVPPAFDLLSIDIDGNDYWVWKSITAYRPRVVVIEYNASVPPTESRVMPYDSNFRWSGTDYFGASLLSLATLGSAKGYTLVGCDSSGTNAFFVDAAEAQGRFVPQCVGDLYRAPNYKKTKRHPHDSERTLMPI
jgi:hypothetical protein